MKHLYVGLDGGGTKTEVCMIDEQKREVERFQTGSINLAGQNRAAVQENLSAAVRKIVMLGSGADLAGMWIGAAGVSHPEAQQVLKQAVRSGGYAGKLHITGDPPIALAGALGRAVGSILISGTGSICYGRLADGKEARTGGWGHLVDDEGSGYAIGRDILSAVLHAQDGRLSATILTSLVFDALQVDCIAGVLEFVYRPDRPKKEIAALARLLNIACELGDEAAVEIAQTAAKALVRLVSPVLESLKLQKEKLALAGGVLQHISSVKARTMAILTQQYPELILCIPEKDAAYGAALMAFWETLE